MPMGGVLSLHGLVCLAQAKVDDPKVNMLMVAAETRHTTKWVPQVIEPNK